MEKWVTEFRQRFVKGHPPIANGANDVIDAEAWVEAEPEEMEAFIGAAIAAERARFAPVIEAAKWIVKRDIASADPEICYVREDDVDKLEQALRAAGVEE